MSTPKPNQVERDAKDHEHKKPPFYKFEPITVLKT
jgi:hypothetical protein